MLNCKFDYIFKILIIGDSGVGKTQFLNKFLDDNSTLSGHLTSIGK